MTIRTLILIPLLSAFRIVPLVERLLQVLPARRAATRLCTWMALKKSLNKQNGHFPGFPLEGTNK